MDLNNINKSSSVFWSLGNDPTQKVNNLTAYYVVEHLKLLYLLSDKVLAASSFYFESDITREVTDKLQRLFEEREILFFIDADKEDFKEHAVEKVKKSPKSLKAYNNKELVDKRAKHLDSLFPPLRRPPSSISDKIVELWIQEIKSEDQDSLGGFLKSIIKEKDKRIEIIVSLSNFATERKKDFVWEYIQPHLSKLNLNSQFQNYSRRKLSQLYSIATAEILGVSLDRNDFFYKKYISGDSKYDTTLFYECMKILNVSDAMQNLNAFDLIKLKSSLEFIIFREWYFSLINSTSFNIGLSKRVLSLFVDTENTLINRKINVTEFLESFSKYCKSLNIHSKNYIKPLELILDRFQALNKATIIPFLDTLNEIADNKQTVKFNSSQFIDGSGFYLANRQTIDNIITNKFHIPKTDAPHRFGEMVNIIIKWFDNFKRSEFPLALSILQNIICFSEYEVNDLLDKMSAELKNLFKNDFSKVNIFGLGDFGSNSGQQFLYKLRQHLKISDKNFPKDYNNISSDVHSIVFIDDVIGSGKQATEFYLNKLSKISIDTYYYSLLAYEDGITNIKKDAGFKKVLTTKLLTECDKAFSDNSEIFPDPITRERIKQFCYHYGMKLYPKWPLGYENSQALIAFFHNTPDNTLPIIWASPNNEKEIGEPWNPLWERKSLGKNEKSTFSDDKAPITTNPVDNITKPHTSSKNKPPDAFTLLTTKDKDGKLGNLFNSLKSKQGFITSDTKLSDFRKIFNNSSNITPIKWSGNITELAFFVRLLHDNELIKDLKHNKWIVTCKCFHDQNDNPYTSNQLKSVAPDTPSRAPDLEQAIKSLM